MLSALRGAGPSKARSALENSRAIRNIISRETHEDQRWSFPVDSFLLQTHLLTQ